METGFILGYDPWLSVIKKKETKFRFLRSEQLNVPDW
jgi:hypothetical protein